MKVSLFKNIWRPLVYLLLLFVVVQGARQAGYGLVRQDSASMPEGWYVALPLFKPLHLGETVLFQPPRAVKQYLVRHHWIGKNQWMMKKVKAVPGDFVCAKNQWMMINGRQVAPIALTYDGVHRLMQHSFCRSLARHEYLLMSERSIKSYDGRYFGPVNDHNIKSQAVLL